MRISPCRRRRVRGAARRQPRAPARAPRPWPWPSPRPWPPSAVRAPCARRDSWACAPWMGSPSAMRRGASRPGEVGSYTETAAWRTRDRRTAPRLAPSVVERGGIAAGAGLDRAGVDAGVESPPRLVAAELGTDVLALLRRPGRLGRARGGVGVRLAGHRLVLRGNRKTRRARPAFRQPAASRAAAGSASQPKTLRPP